jgi:hypothetical protein
MIAGLAKRGDHESVRNLIKIQAQLYDDVKRRSLSTQYVVKGKTTGRIVSGGLPSLGKRR